MSDTHIQVHGVRFAVQHRGFEDKPMDLHAGLSEVDAVLSRMPASLVKTIHQRALDEEENLAGTGVTNDIAKLEKLAFARATKDWTGEKDAYIWLRAV